MVAGTYNARHQFDFPGPQYRGSADIAIVDVGNAGPSRQFSDLSGRHAGAVPILVSDSGKEGNSPYRLARKRVLLRIRQLLEQVVDEGLVGAKPWTLGQRAVPLHKSATTSSDNRTEATARGPAEIEKTELPECAQPTFRLKALVVDDSATARLLTCNALSQVGFDCLEARHAMQAKEILVRHRVDLALLDVEMPSVSGFELCREIKHARQTRKLVVIMLTSRSSPFDRARGAFSGCNGYLAKPLCVDALQRMLVSVLPAVTGHTDIARWPVGVSM